MGKHQSSTSRTRKKRRTRRTILAIALIAVLTSLIVLAIYIFTPPAHKAPPTPTPSVDDNNNKNPDDEIDGLEKPTVDNIGSKQRKSNVYTILLIGTMDDYNTDTIMLGSIDTDKKKVDFVSIPRDTMVDVESSNKKINGAYGRSGIDELKREVAEITGIYPDYHVVINVESFIQVVDLFGGISFDVPYDMHHTDLDPEFTINLKKGVQVLDGKKALQMCRYRGTAQSDLGRMELQREFLMALCKKVISEFSVSQVKDMMPIINESVKTNMGLKDMLWFYMNVARGINFDNDLQFHAMPIGSTGYYKKLSYVYLNAEDVVKTLNETINPYTTDITVDDVHIIHLEND